MGNVVVKYTYNAWSECQTTVLDESASEIANLNPFRYRSYYLDTETNLYYLNTRYYDPEVGRFITIDDISYLAPDTINGINLYAYCLNDPVNKSDPDGNFPFHLLIGGVIGGIIGGVSAALSGEDVTGVIIGSLGGIASGVLTASGVGVVGQVIASAAISMATNAAVQVKNIVTDETGTETFDVGDMIFDGVVSAATAVWGGNGSSYGNAAGINASWNQLFKKGIFNKNARSYFYKTAHNASKKFVLSSLTKSLAKNASGTTIVTIKNKIRGLF